MSAARRTRLPYLLLVLPFVGPLWVPLFNRIEPRFCGIPFFYWFQLFWILFGSLVTALVYVATSRRGESNEAREQTR
jgi:hypothetical protein